MEINYDHEKRAMPITQKKYLETTAEISKQNHNLTVENPCDPGTRLSKKDSPTTKEEEELMNRTPYRQLIGRLLYLQRAHGRMWHSL